MRQMKNNIKKGNLTEYVNKNVWADGSTMYNECKNNVEADDPVRPLLKRNPQRGITLIALVITIIVLLILAVVTITIITNSGLITKTSDATTQHTIAAEKEIIGLRYSEYQMALANKENVTQPTIEGAEVTSKGEGWNVTFTKTNNEYQLSKNGDVLLAKQNGIDVIWTDNGDDTFTKGDVTVKIGDIVNYDEGTGYSTTVTASQSGYTTDKTYTTENVGWRVLGISENGELELISDNPTNSMMYLKGETGYLNAEEVLNNMCNELYGNGKHATGARSLNVDDINKLANYDLTTDSRYREIWIYRFPKNGDYMQYKRTKSDGTLIRDWTDITNSAWQTFRMPGETETISADNRNDTGRSLEYTYYNYLVEDEVKQITSDGKKMSDIISNGTEDGVVYQWLASRCVSCYQEGARFYVDFVYSNGYGGILYTSDGNSYGGNYSIRPVVTLESDIQLSGNSNDGWTIE